MMQGMFCRWASNPRLYDLGQTLTGARRSRERLKSCFATFPPGARVLDLGGGTGAIRPYLPIGSRYACLDNEWGRLQWLRTVNPEAAAALCDATHVPVQSGSTDAVLCIALSHHLTDASLARMLSEIRRVLKPGGRLVFLDPLASRRPAARLLWSIDRGSCPRAFEVLLSAISDYLTVVHQERYAIWHEYLLVVAIKPQGNGT